MLLNIPENRKTYAIFALGMILLAMLAFGRLYTHQFWEGWDDWDMATDAGCIADDMAYIFSPNRSLPARPPLDVLFLIEHLLWQDHPEGFRMTQVALHLLASLISYHAFRRLGADLEISILASCLFLINVAHFRAIHWAICIDRVAALLFSLGVILSHMQFLHAHKRYWAMTAVACMVVAIFFHPSAASVGIFCLYITWRKSVSVQQALRCAWYILAVSGAAGLLAYWVSPQVNQVEGALTIPDFGRISLNGLWYLGRIYFAGRGYAFRVNNSEENADMATRLFERAIRQSPSLVPIDAYRRLVGIGLTKGNPYRNVVKKGTENWGYCCMTRARQKRHWRCIKLW